MIDEDVKRNVSARINFRTNSRALPLAVRSPVGGHLINFYVTLALTKGKQTTPEDAHAAWLEWLTSQGAVMLRPDLDRVSDFDKRVAEGIVDASRYLTEESYDMG